MNDQSDRDKDIEGLLRSRPIKPPPPELRDRVLKSARASREARAWTTPLLRAALAGAAAMLAVIMIGASLVDHSQETRLQRLLNGVKAMTSEADHEWEALAVNVKDLLTPRELARLKRMLPQPKETRSDGPSEVIRELSLEN